MKSSLACLAQRSFSEVGIRDPYIMISISLIIILHLLIFSVYFVSAKGGEVSPSARIYNLLLRNRKMKEKDLFNSFNNKELVFDRLADLENRGLIRKVDGKYFATSKGRTLASLVNLYRRILGFKLGG